MSPAGREVVIPPRISKRSFQGLKQWNGIVSEARCTPSKRGAAGDLCEDLLISPFMHALSMSPTFRHLSLLDLALLDWLDLISRLMGFKSMWHKRR